MNVVDDFTRECPALEIDYFFASATVVRQPNHIVDERGLPATIRFDNKSEFASRKMLQWIAALFCTSSILESQLRTRRLNRSTVESEMSFLTLIHFLISTQPGNAQRSGGTIITNRDPTLRSDT